MERYIPATTSIAAVVFLVENGYQVFAGNTIPERVSVKSRLGISDENAFYNMVFAE